MTASDLKPCPFCGGEAHIEQIGDRRQSTIYCCNSCGCRLETGEEWDHGRDWNTRATPAALEPVAAPTAKVPEELIQGLREMQAYPDPMLRKRIQAVIAALEHVAVPVTQDKFSAVDHMSRVADTWMHKAEGLQREIDMLTDPVTVHANMLRGTIAKPTIEQIIHLYGVDALVAALAPVIVREAAPYMTDLMVDPEEIPDMEMEYDHRAGASDDE